MNPQEVCCYLMSKYTGREQASLDENIKAYLELNAKGYHAFSPITHSHCIEVERSAQEFKQRKELFQPDYVAEDLFYLSRFMKKDALGRCICPTCNQIITASCDSKKKNYDSGVVGVVLESASETVQYIRMQITKERIDLLQSKYSKGVVQEYEFMQANHILVIDLKTALTQPIEKWEGFAL